MLRFVDIDETSSPAAAEGAALSATVEAQETANQQLYERALAMQSAGQTASAAEAYQELLQQQLVRDAHDTGRQKPSLHLKFLALRNLSELEEAAGAHSRALEHLLEAIKIHENDAVLWQRIGSIGLQTGQPHLARFALEQAVLSSPHHQLASLRLAQVLTSLGDVNALAQLQRASKRRLPHIAPHLTPSSGSAGSLRNISTCAAAASGVNAETDRAKRQRKAMASSHPIEVRLSELKWAAVAEALTATWLRFALPASSDEGPDDDGGAAGRPLSLIAPDPEAACHAEDANTSSEDVSVADDGSAPEEDEQQQPQQPQSQPQPQPQPQPQASTEPPEFMHESDATKTAMDCEPSEPDSMPAQTSAQDDPMGVDGSASQLLTSDPGAKSVVVDVPDRASATASATQAASMACIDDTNQPIVNNNSPSDLHAAQTMDVELHGSDDRAIPEVMANNDQAPCGREADITANTHSTTTQESRGKSSAPSAPLERSRKQPARHSRKGSGRSAATVMTSEADPKHGDDAVAQKLDIAQLLQQFAGEENSNNASTDSATVTMEVRPAAMNSNAEHSSNLTTHASSDTVLGTEQSDVGAIAVNTAFTEEATVRHWLCRPTVASNSGVLHLSLLLLDTLLSAKGIAADEPCNESGSASTPTLWTICMSIAQDERKRLAQSLLQLHRSMSLSVNARDSTTRTLLSLASDAMWLPRRLDTALSLVELQLDTFATQSSSAQLPAQLTSAVSALDETLTALQAKLQWTGACPARTISRPGGNMLPQLRVWQLLVRLSWARAQCEELLGRTNGSVSHLCECELLLQAHPSLQCDNATALSDVHPFTLLSGPVTISIDRVRALQSRQLHTRMIDFAYRSLGSMHVQSMGCICSEWVCEVRDGEVAAGADALHRCALAWGSVQAAISSAIARASTVKDRAVSRYAQTDGSGAANDSLQTLVESEASPLCAAVRMLNVCWIGLCMQSAPNQHASLSVGSPPHTEGHSIEGPAAAHVLAADGRADTKQTQPQASPADVSSVANLTDAFVSYLLCTRDALRAAVLAWEQSLDLDSAAANVVPPMRQEADGTAADKAACASSSSTAGTGNGRVRIERRVTGWLARLIQSVDCFQQRVRRMVTQCAVQQAATEGDEVPLKSEPEMLPPMGVGSHLSQACVQACHQVLCLLSAVAQRVSCRPAPSKVLVHYTLTCFCKIWMLSPRGPAESLLLLHSAWNALTLPDLCATSVPVSADVNGDARQDGRGGGAAARGKTGGSQAHFARRQPLESPLAQLCMVSALAHLRYDQDTRLDAPQLEISHFSLESGDANSIAMPTGEGAQAGAAYTGQDDVNPNRKASDSISPVNGHGEGCPALPEESRGGSDAPSTLLPPAGELPSQTQHEDEEVGGDKGEGGVEDGEGEAVQLSAAELARRTAMLDALRAAFKQARFEEPSERLPVPGAEGWQVFWKPRLRKVAGGVSGDVYFVTPEGKTLDSIRKIALHLEVEAPTHRMESRPIATSKPNRTHRAPHAWPEHGRRQKQQQTVAGQAGDDSQTHVATVRQGWQELLHVVCHHLYGTQAEALGCLRAVEIDQSKKDERRKALSGPRASERAALLEYLLRLSPVPPPLESAGDDYNTIRTASVGRKTHDPRLRELKVQLRKLLPSEACPGSTPSLPEDDGARLWLIPPPQGMLPPHAQSLLSRISSVYAVRVATAAPTSEIPTASGMGVGGPGPTGTGTVITPEPDNIHEGASGESTGMNSGESHTQGNSGERSLGAFLCCALAAVEALIAEADWSAAMMAGTELARFDRAQIPGSADDVSMKWQRNLSWVLALMAQALRLCAWRSNPHLPFDVCPILLAPAHGPQVSLFDHPYQLALAFGTYARKLWHLHVDACRAQQRQGASRVAATSVDDAIKDDALLYPATHAIVHRWAKSPVADEGLPKRAPAKSSTSQSSGLGTPALARAAATMCQHCLRWLIQQPLLAHDAASASGLAQDTAQASDRETSGISAASCDREEEPDAEDMAGSSSRVGASARLLAKARDELAVCLHTEAQVLTRSDDALLRALREDCHKSHQHAMMEIAELLDGGDPQDLVGQDIDVHWPFDRAWYRCRILEYSNQVGAHRLHYENDGVEEWLDLRAEEWRPSLVRANEASAGRRHFFTSRWRVALARSPLSHQLLARALQVIHESPSESLRELSLAVRLATGTAPSEGQHVQALHDLAAAQAEMLIECEDEASKVRLHHLRAIAKHGVGATLEVVGGKPLHTAYKRRGRKRGRKALDQRKAEDARDAVVADDPVEIAIGRDDGTIAGASADAEQAAPRENLTISDVEGDPRGSSASNLGCNDDLPQSVDASQMLTDAPDGLLVDEMQKPNWAQLVADCEHALTLCLQRRPYQYRSRLLLARIAWQCGRRGTVARRHCEYLVTRHSKGGHSKKPTLMWSVWQFATCGALDDCSEGLALRSYEVRDDCATLGCLYVTSLTADALSHPIPFTDPARPLMLLRALVDFFEQESMSAMRKYAILCYAVCLTEHIDAHVASMRSTVPSVQHGEMPCNSNGDERASGPLTSMGHETEKISSLGRMEVDTSAAAACADRERAEVVACAEVFERGAEVPIADASETSVNAGTDKAAERRRTSSRSTMTFRGCGSGANASSTLNAATRQAKQDADLLTRRRELMRHAYELQAENDFVSMLSELSGTHSAQTLLSNAFSSYRSIQLTVLEREHQQQSERSERQSKPSPQPAQSQQAQYQSLQPPPNEQAQISQPLQPPAHLLQPLQPQPHQLDGEGSAQQTPFGQLPPPVGSFASQDDAAATIPCAMSAPLQAAMTSAIVPDAAIAMGCGHTLPVSEEATLMPMATEVSQVESIEPAAGMVIPNQKATPLGPCFAAQPVVTSTHHLQSGVISSLPGESAGIAEIVAFCVSQFTQGTKKGAKPKSTKAKSTTKSQPLHSGPLQQGTMQTNMSGIQLAGDLQDCVEQAPLPDTLGPDVRHDMAMGQQDDDVAVVVEDIDA